MKTSLVSSLLLVCSVSVVSAFVAPRPFASGTMTQGPFAAQFMSSSSLQLSSSTVETEPFAKSERVIMDELPILYVYDHCPFCVRVRLALGIKNVKHTVYFLANDDIPTPTKLVGKKIAPIFVSVLYLTLSLSL